MFAVKTIAATTVTGLLLAGTANAALTADQVWARWQETAAVAGLTLAAEGTATEGDTLRLSGVTVRPAIPSGADDPEGAIAEIAMTTQSDGSVAIALAPEFSVPIVAMGGGVTVTQDGLSLTAREEGAGIAYDYAAASVKLAVAASVGGGTDESNTTDFTMTATNANGTYSDVLDASRLINLILNTDLLVYSVKTDTPAMTMTSDQTTELADVAMNMALDIPASARLGEVDSAGDFSTLLKDGLSVNLEMTQGDSKGADKETNPYLSYELITTGLPGSAKMSLDQTGFGVIVTGEGGSLAGTSDMLPVPVNLGFGPIAMDFLMPMTGTEPQDFRYIVSMQDVVVNEEAWALIDAGKTLPRDPANLNIDASGKASLDLFALMEAEEAGTTEGVTPPAIESLDIKSLALSIAGAAVSGSGAFTFDNSTATPVPLGTADVTVTGANGLIDKLVTLGLLPDDQAQSARMMMGMFLTPGEGDDVLTSKIEAQEGGSIFVNGMQIQ
jgi:Uncharacterized protein conserved in bacteria (DUF2125)